MNKQSSLVIAASFRIDPRTGSRLCKAFVLTLMMLAGIEMEADTFAGAASLEQSSPQKKSATKQVKSYSCPMHPEVKSTKPGKCPKCKMDLRLERAATSYAVTDTRNLMADNSVAKTAVISATSTDAADTSSNAPASATKIIIPDVEVLDQNGNALHFYSDLIKGKTVAINFIFTNHVSWLEDLVYQIDITSGNAGRQCDNTHAR